MKIRTSFVSNSSSSSFMCLVTGEIFSGMDADPQSFGIVECENGHEFGEDFVVEVSEEIQFPADIDYVIKELEEIAISPYNYMINDYPERIEEAQDFLLGMDEYVKDMELFYETFEDILLDAEYILLGKCPICTLTHITDEHILNYLLKLFGEGGSREKVMQKLQKDFSSLDELEEYKL